MVIYQCVCETKLKKVQYPQQLMVSSHVSLNFLHSRNALVASQQLPETRQHCPFHYILLAKDLQFPYFAVSICTYIEQVRKNEHLAILQECSGGTRYLVYQK